MLLEHMSDPLSPQISHLCPCSGFKSHHQGLFPSRLQRCVASVALSTFYTLCLHKAEGGVDIIHLLEGGTEAQTGQVTRPRSRSQKDPEPGFEHPALVVSHRKCSNHSSTRPTSLFMNE